MFKKFEVTSIKENFLFYSYFIFILGFFYFPKSTLHSNFFIIAIMLPFLFQVFMKRIDISILLSSKIFLVSIVFVLYMFSTVLWGIDFELKDLVKNGRRALYIVVFLAVTMYLHHKHTNFLEKLLVMLCWVGVIAAILNIIFFYSQNTFPDYRLTGYGRMSNPIQAATIYGLIFIACINLLQQQISAKSKLSYAVIIAVVFSYMILSQARGPLLALAGTLIVWSIVILIRSDKMSSKYRILLPAISILIIVTGLAMLMLFPDYTQSFVSRGGGGTGYRLEIWGRFILEAKDALWFGHGLNADANIILADGTEIQNPHGFYVSTLYYGGLSGLLLLVILVLLTLWQGYIRANNQMYTMLGSMFLFGAVCVLADGHTLLQHVKPYWLFFWFPIALIAVSELPENSGQQQELVVSKAL